MGTDDIALAQELFKKASSPVVKLDANGRPKPTCRSCGEVFLPNWPESDAKNPATNCSRVCELNPVIKAVA
jgi:hypothetical protein